MFEEFMNTETLTTFAGLTTAVILIVQFTKSLIKKKFGDVVVRLYSFVIALLLTFIFTNDGNSPQEIIITIINAIMITISSMGGYELIADPMALKTRQK